MKDYYLCSKISYPKDKYVLYYIKTDVCLVVFFADGHHELFTQNLLELEKKYLECMEQQIYTILDLHEKEFFWNLNNVLIPVGAYYILKCGRFINFVYDLLSSGVSLQAFLEYFLLSIPIFISYRLSVIHVDKYKMVKDDFEKNKMFLKIQNRLHNYRMFEPQLFYQALDDISDVGKKIFLNSEDININSIHNVSHEDVMKLVKNLK